MGQKACHVIGLLDEDADIEHQQKLCKRLFARHSLTQAQFEHR